MIILFIICCIIDQVDSIKWAKERDIPKNKKPVKRDYSNGYRVRTDIPYRGKYNDIY